MSLSMYDASIPLFIRTLTNLNAILDKAENFAENKKIESTILVNSRLAADMYPLSRQIQIATDISKGCAARLSGMTVPVYEDNETTISELKARIQKTLKFFQEIAAEKVNGSEEKEITIKLGGQDRNFKGQPYLLHFVIPNFYFHVSMAYAILRHNGVELGKRDFMGV